VVTVLGFEPVRAVNVEKDPGEPPESSAISTTIVSAEKPEEFV
jgi:hypothetical protein